MPIVASGKYFFFQTRGFGFNRFCDEARALSLGRVRQCADKSHTLDDFSRVLRARAAYARLALVWGEHFSDNRFSSRWHFIKNSEIQIAIERERERARDWCRGH